MIKMNEFNKIPSTERKFKKILQLRKKDNKKSSCCKWRSDLRSTANGELPAHVAGCRLPTAWPPSLPAQSRTHMSAGRGGTRFRRKRSDKCVSTWPAGAPKLT